MTTEAHIQTTTPTRYIKRLCKHFAHKVPATYTEDSGHVPFPFGTCTMQAEANMLILHGEADDETALARIEGVLASHLEGFAQKEELTINWTRSTADVLPAQPNKVPPLADYDRTRVASYDERVRRISPGYEVLHATSASLLENALGPEAHLLIAGAGTGAEILRLGQRNPSWRFTAVDPSAAMLDVCRANVAEAGLNDRVDFVCARMQDLPGDSLFDAATSICVAHFIHDQSDRHRYFQTIASRLHPHSPFVLADLYQSCTADTFDALFDAWRDCVAQNTGDLAQEIKTSLDRTRNEIYFVQEPALEELLSETGFEAPIRFYQHFLWGAWMTTKQ